MRNMVRSFRRAALPLCLLFAVQVFAFDGANDRTTPARVAGYQKPPKVITDVLESPATPIVVVSPTRDRLLIVDSKRHPSIADLAQPMLRLAGYRINPATNGPHHPLHVTGLRVLDIATRKEQKIAAAGASYLNSPMWSPDGQRIAFMNFSANATELWVANAASASAHKVAGVAVNAAYGTPLQWMPDSRTLLVQIVPAERGKPPAEPAVPDGPIVQESYGKAAPLPTFEDLLASPYDEDLWDYYATSQLAFVDAESGKITKIGKPAVIAHSEVSPDGAHVLVVRNVRPYSYLLPARGFPKVVEVWSRTGQLEHTLATLPSDEGVPLEGVPTGPRNYAWRATEPATLVWVEALDKGDTLKPAPVRDRILMLRAPFKAQPTEIMKLEQRYFAGAFGFARTGNGMDWLESGHAALIRDYDRKKRWVRTFEVNFDGPAQQPKLIWSMSSQERYKDPGDPVTRTLKNGRRVVAQNGNSIFLIGEGATPQGDRPFLDRFDLETQQSERLFRSAEKVYEDPIALLSDDGSRFLTRFESPTDPPNYFAHAANSDAKQQLTNFPDPAPQLRGITKQLVTYKRDDGVPLSFELYLPAGYKPGTPLPTIVWAYPREFNDASTAGQVTGSPNRFVQINGMSELWLLTQGYAILDNATMPVIGDPDTMNNTYVEQIVASAKAAIDKAVEMGVTDRNRVGVGGHSYGAFMTANLLAHSDLFRAGVARSGAYNRTLTPFGFQNERRTFWEAPDTYFKMSPFMFADKLKKPILLIHGMADDNSGTFPIQSERLYQAIKGNGGNVRYVQLPYEAHGYVGLQSVEHTLYEMISWFDKYVKNPQASESTVAASH